MKTAGVYKIKGKTYKQLRGARAAVCFRKVQGQERRRPIWRRDDGGGLECRPDSRHAPQKHAR